MKKLMIAAAIVCAAAFANAATVGWSMPYIASYGADGTGWGAGDLTGEASVQLIIGSTLSDGVVSGDIYNNTVDLTFSEGYAEPDALVIAGMSSDTPYYSQLIITQGDSILKSGIFEVQASSVDNDYTAPGWCSLMEGVAGLTDAADATHTLTGLSTFNETYGTYTSAGWQSVPEPTSGLLLLIGVAGLALRRRRS